MHSAPNWLFRLHFKSGTLRAASRLQVTWNDELFPVVGFDPPTITGAPASGQAGSFSVIAEYRAFAAQVLNENPRGKRIEIYRSLQTGVPGFEGFEAPIDITHAELVFDGVMNNVQPFGVGEKVTVNITTEGRLNSKAPRLRFLPPLCNHLPAPGTVITWGGERYILEKQ